MAEQVDTTFREVLSQMSQADLVRLLPWFLSATANPSAGPICSISEAFTTFMQSRADVPADNTTPGFEGSPAPASMNSPVCQASSLPPPVLLMSDIPAAGIPIGNTIFKLTISPKCKKWDCSPSSTLNDQGDKGACAETAEADASGEHMFSSTQPEPDNGAWSGTSCSSDHPETKIIDLIASPAKGAADSNDGVAVEASGSTRDCDRDSARDISGDNLTRALRSPTQAVSHGQVPLTPTRIQQLGIASPAQTQRRHQLGPPTRSSVRRCGPPAGLLARVLGRWPNGTDWQMSSDYVGE